MTKTVELEALRARYERALGDRTAPLAFVDLDALEHNARLMLEQASPLPIRLASKSIRSVAVLRHAYDLDERFHGVMAFTVAEALHLAEAGFDDILVAYPSVDREALAAVARRAAEGAPGRIVAMVDSVGGAEIVAEAARRAGVELPVAIDLDAGFITAQGRVHIGPKRSPVRTAHQAAALARAIGALGGLRVVGVMAYEGQVAGVGDRVPGKPLRSAAITVLLRATEISTPTRTPIAIAGRTGMSASSANQVEKAPHVRI